MERITNQKGIDKLCFAAMFNASHPELKEGEVWLINAEESDWLEIQKVYPTARRGNTPYSRTGDTGSGVFGTLRRYFPVFVQEKDVPVRGIVGIYDPRIQI